MTDPGPDSRVYVEVRTEGCTCVLIDRSVWSWTWNANGCTLHDPRLTTAPADVPEQLAAADGEL